MEPGEAQNPLTQLRRGVIEYCVLALLTTDELYGFDLVKRLGESEGLVTSEGTIYPLLSRMRRAGWVTTTWRESESGPPRRYYAITRSGQHALDGFATEWSRFRDSVDGVLGTGEGQHGARRG
ncbi:MAG TPA: PadR family transcriptional regulator [Candidatus Nanopelagicales bacterium]